MTLVKVAEMKSYWPSLSSNDYLQRFHRHWRCLQSHTMAPNHSKNNGRTDDLWVELIDKEKGMKDDGLCVILIQSTYSLTRWRSRTIPQLEELSWKASWDKSQSRIVRKHRLDYESLHRRLLRSVWLWCWIASHLELERCCVQRLHGKKNQKKYLWCCPNNCSEYRRF